MSLNATGNSKDKAVSMEGGSIHVLPPDVVDRIAAGEVVQRPVSAVKELLENSLDAGSTHILCQVEKHGKQKTMNVSIHDNGTGIGKNDLQMAATRFATSKLTTVADFDSLTSFGFRGEALASISMVSHMSVTSKQPGAKCAYTCAYLDGKPKPNSCKPCARQVGTTVTVNDLFYNVPHRQKSLRPSDEYQRILSLLQQYAIQVARRGVGLVCQQDQANNKKLVDLNTTLLSQVKAVAAARRLQEKQDATCTIVDNGEKRDVQKSFSTDEEQAATRQAITNIYGSQLEPHLFYFQCQSLDLEPVPSTQDSSASKDSASTGLEQQLPLRQPSQSPPTSYGQWEDVRNPDSKDSSLLLAKETMQYACEGFLTSPFKGQDQNNISSNPQQFLVKHCGGKSTTFVLFVNARLVECPALKRQVEDAYASVTPWPKPPFCYLSLQVPPNQVDVNVHPSKSQVALLFLEDIVHDIVRKHILPILSQQGRSFSSSNDKSFKTQSPTTSTPSTQSTSKCQAQSQSKLGESTSKAPPATNTTESQKREDEGTNQSTPTANTAERPRQDMDRPSEVAAAAAAAALAMTTTPASTPQSDVNKPKLPSIYWSPAQQEQELEWGRERKASKNKWSQDPEWNEFWQQQRDNRRTSPYAEKAKAKRLFRQQRKKRAKASENNSNDDDGDKKPPAKKRKKPSSQKIRTDIKIPLGSLEPFLEPQPMSVMMADARLQFATPKNQRIMLAEQAAKLAATKTPEDRTAHHFPDCPLLKNATADDPAVDLTNPGEFAKVAKECTCRQQLPPDFRVQNPVQRMIRPAKIRPTKVGYISIGLLRKRVKEATDEELLNKLRQAYFVGVLSRDHSLIQCQDQLCLMNHAAFAKVLFAQMALARFGPDGLAVRVARVGKASSKNGKSAQGEGLDVQTLVEQALHMDEGDEHILQSNQDNAKIVQEGLLRVSEANALLARQATDCFRSNAEMLKEYFGIWFEEVKARASTSSPGVTSPCLVLDKPNTRLMLTALPIIMDGHLPSPHGLPQFLLRLATEVDWVQERCCFDGVCRELGFFYGQMPMAAEGQDDRFGSDRAHRAWVQHVLFPAVSCLLEPPERLNARFVTITSLTKLYKDFQR